MGLGKWFREEVVDDALGFDPKDQAKFADKILGIDPPKVRTSNFCTTLPATNTPTPAPAQTSFDRVQSYLAAQRQKSFNEQLKQKSTAEPEFGPPSFSQTVEGQKMIKLVMYAALAWLFLFKGKL